MKKLDNIRFNQSIRQNKKDEKNKRQSKSKSRRSPAFRTFVMTLKVCVIAVLLTFAVIMIWAYNQVDFAFGDDLNAYNMKLSSTILVKDKNGEFYEYEQFNSTDKRIWAESEEIPQNMKDAFVAIEDQRFYSHHGVDLRRTFGAAINVFVKGDSSYGGSTITQQLIKNITQDNERTTARKVREISRALVLESKLSKDEILELYMNSIYLSQGVHGVQAASKVYFNKDVDELSLAQCASIAGITQYPTTYDPIINPENNRRKQLTVLQKMLELKFISEEEYNEAINEEMVFEKYDGGADIYSIINSQSYFSDHIFEQAKKDLMEKFEYSEQYTENLLCNGGLKIYSTMDPEIQKVAEEYYENEANFPRFSGNAIPQSAIVITDHSTGQLKAIVGGRGRKENARVLNRATQSQRQPGSTIKPIAVYAPALEENIVNLCTLIDNSPIKIGGWEPSNANGKFSGPVPITTAVAWSYNMPAIRTLQALTVDTSFDYLHNKMHINSIVDEEVKNGMKYTDKNLSSLALGGLTHGVTPLEMSTAYSSIANGGMYIEPVSYTKICDISGKVLLEKKPEKNRVFSEETAFLTQELLKGVVRGGTAGGTIIQGIDTCGKTGTTDDNKDKWFVGFTPYYCATVWFGYDSPRVISSGSNPAVKVWRDIMTPVHQGLENARFEVPSGITRTKVCGFTGKHASSECGSVQYANKRFLTGYCRNIHKNNALGSMNVYVDPEKEANSAAEGETTEGDVTLAIPDGGSATIDGAVSSPTENQAVPPVTETNPAPQDASPQIQGIQTPPDTGAIPPAA